MLEGVTVGILSVMQKRKTGHCVVIHLLIAITLTSLKDLYFSRWFFSEEGYISVVFLLLCLSLHY